MTFRSEDVWGPCWDYSITQRPPGEQGARLWVSYGRNSRWKSRDRQRQHRGVCVLLQGWKGTKWWGDSDPVGEKHLQDTAWTCITLGLSDDNVGIYHVSGSTGDLLDYSRCDYLTGCSDSWMPWLSHGCHFLFKMAGSFSLPGWVGVPLGGNLDGIGPLFIITLPG